ncbi:TIGR01244 family sulfur transferase [Altererythrobacter sp. KTW20L]|uniref:TIGR01244 family sulfur transferase n=1 Tax=Altererythrobacter sp. KTW20L TaxID=2942210 RepID=UPI0020BD6D06|nr:TIGR01244 family sulfur transferase [Altererythrobacter sp. KTW20L]MCL6249820.1 TIGR01244 family sulfur transferase [Altererythrobacter sp. KTW20L]
MSDFRQLSDAVWASPQITVEDVELAGAQGFSLIVNNRPEGESGDQTDGETIAEVARSHGMAYCAIPISHSGFNQDQVDRMAEVLETAPGPVLAYCRSGTRSTLLWALARASRGASVEDLAAAAAAAGYDLSPIAPALHHYAAQAKPAG